MRDRQEEGERGRDREPSSAPFRAGLGSHHHRGDHLLEDLSPSQWLRALGLPPRTLGHGVGMDLSVRYGLHNGTCNDGEVAPAARKH